MTRKLTSLQRARRDLADAHEMITQLEEQLDDVKAEHSRCIARAKKWRTLLCDARDLLYREQVASMAEGRAYGYLSLPSGGTAPVGWRVNGIAELIRTFDTVQTA